MATSIVLSSIIVALRPKFRQSSHDQSCLHCKFRLAKLRQHRCARLDSVKSTADAGNSEGWNASSDTYTFLYNPDLTNEGVVQHPMLLKGVVVGDKLVLNWLSLQSSEADPAQLELDIHKFTTSSEAVPGCYQHLADLIGTLRSKIKSASHYAGNRQQAESSQNKQHTDTTRTSQQQPDFESRQDDFPQAPKRLAEQPGRMIGSNDAVPPGFRPPGYGSLQEPFPGGIGGTGGMHMGPDDPLIAGRAGRGRQGRSGLLPPGARYDPIGPPGMPGFEPDDFVTGQRGVHPDMAQPGPGRGTDWDSMFG